MDVSGAAAVHSAPLRETSADHSFAEMGARGTRERASLYATSESPWTRIPFAKNRTIRRARRSIRIRNFRKSLPSSGRNCP